MFFAPLQPWDKDTRCGGCDIKRMRKLNYSEHGAGNKINPEDHLPNDLDPHVLELTEHLQQAVQKQEAAEKELDSMLYHISHDLRAPLRGIDGYSQALLEDYGERLDEMGKAYLLYIRESSARLSQIIDGILILSRIIRADLEITTVDLSAMATEIARELKQKEPDRNVEIVITPGMITKADPRLARLLLQCLLDNAFKFTAPRPITYIEFGCNIEQDQTTYYIRDNGVGFETTYQEQLFQPFQRLHGQREFEGVGLGLANVKQIIQRHNGRVWANGAVGEGATIYFKL